MNEAFNRRARQVFGDTVGDMLDEGNHFAGRYMDDASDMPSASSIINLPPEEQRAVVAKAEEKVKLYNMFCKKFVCHPSNADPVPYDTYTGV